MTPESAPLVLSLRIPPRRFSVGTDSWVTLSDCGTVRPAPGQEVVVRLQSLAVELTVTRRPWGYEVTLPQGQTAKGAANLIVAGRSPDRLHLLLHAAGTTQQLDAYMAREEMIHRAPLDELLP